MAVFTRPTLAAGPATSRLDGADADLDPVERVRRFRATASQSAFQLAGYLAAAPPSMPVMRLVQDLMLPGSRQGDLAEVFLAGLMCRVTPADVPTHPEQVRYDFRPGVRDVLLTTLDRRTELRILNRVSDFVRRRLGGTLDFPALVAGIGDPGKTRRRTGRSQWLLKQFCTAWVDGVVLSPTGWPMSWFRCEPHGRSRMSSSAPAPQYPAADRAPCHTTAVSVAPREGKEMS
jgi:hypothetical protein